MKTAFIGHRYVLAENICDKLENAILTEINNGCKMFTMGTHGEFDRFALNACRRLRSICNDLEIEVAITSLNTLKKDGEFDDSYDDVRTVMYNIENAHYKRQITLSNRQMIDTSDTLICYVDTNAYRSGAKSALLYAQKKGLKIINLYREEEQPFYGKTFEQMQEHWNIAYEKVVGKKK